MGAIMKIVLLVGLLAIPFLASPLSDKQKYLSIHEKHADQELYNDPPKMSCDDCKQACNIAPTLPPPPPELKESQNKSPPSTPKDKTEGDSPKSRKRRDAKSDCLDICEKKCGNGSSNGGKSSQQLISGGILSMIVLNAISILIVKKLF